MIPNPETWIVYGVPLVLVIAAVRYMLRMAFGSDSKWELVGTGVATVLGYVLVSNLTFLESLIPGLPVWLKQVLEVILLIGGVLGFTPGAKFAQLARSIRVKILGRHDKPWM